MFTVTVIDYLSDDHSPQVVETYGTEADARTAAAMHFEDAASYSDYDLPNDRDALLAAGVAMGMLHGPRLQVRDGFCVAITPTSRLDVYRLHDGDWFASLHVEGTDYNAPSDTPARAALQAWSSYTAHRVVIASLRATYGTPA